MLTRMGTWLMGFAPVRGLVHVMPRSLQQKLWRHADHLYAQGARSELLREIHHLIRMHLQDRVMAEPRSRDPKRLLSYGFKVYAHYDEDGILEEVFKRVGLTNRYFVEFGVGYGLQNNTLYLLLQGWRGAWIEGSSLCCEAIKARCEFLIKADRLRVHQGFITAENIEELFRGLDVPAEFDLLCIDIDNNDYWVWRAIQQYRPRVVAIEYNATFRSSVSCVVPYNPAAMWNHTNYFGASLKAMEELGRSKGYCLVGCNYVGSTGFFIREDLVGDRFAEPFTAENHYEPPRGPVQIPFGHPPGFGPVVLSPKTAEPFSGA
jgi:hypothetical protein